MIISIVRTVILFITIVASLRIMGKRQLGELEPADLVVAVLISDLASQPLQDPETPLIYGLAPVLTLLSLQVLISAAINRSVKFRSLICGRPSMIIENGIILQSEMKKNRFTIDELTEELRKNGVSDIASVKYAILETDGTLSTLLFPEYSPLTPKDAGVAAQKLGYPVIVINNGVIIHENLKVLGKSEHWLYEQMGHYGAESPENVYLMSADCTGKIYYAPMEGKK